MTVTESTLQFKLEEKRDGVDVTPDTVDLPTLRGFLEEVEGFVKGDEPNPNLRESQVKIEEGSLKVMVFVPIILAHSVTADLERVAESGDLDSMQPKRASILEKWQARSGSSESLSYSLGLENSVEPIVRISKENQLKHGQADSWVAIEKYISGRVVDQGGKKKPNVHLVLEDGSSLKVSATEALLAAEKDNHLYQEMTLRVEAEEHLQTGALRNIRLLEFQKQETEIDEEALEKLWKRGTEAWSSVKDSVKWVEELRGHG
jgi:hypothetical protein